jgi:hypothetical protein
MRRALASSPGWFQRTITPAHPWSDGKVEALKRTVRKSIERLWWAWADLGLAIAQLRATLETGVNEAAAVRSERGPFRASEEGHGLQPVRDTAQCRSSETQPPQARDLPDSNGPPLPGADGTCGCRIQPVKQPFFVSLVAVDRLHQHVLYHKGQGGHQGRMPCALRRPGMGLACSACRD